MFLNYICNKVLNSLSKIAEKDVYALSFNVNSNETNEFSGITNLPTFSIQYNTESACNNSNVLSEERWNTAFWESDEIFIVDAYSDKESVKLLLNWYDRIGVTDIGYENCNLDYDENYNYVGKGPNGYYEFLCFVSDVAKIIRTENLLPDMLKGIPIIVHDNDYSWFSREATERANPNGEADAFLKFLDNWGM